MAPQLGQSGVIMMAVAFHALIPNAAHGKILQERHGANITQVLAAHNGCFLAAALLDKATVGGENAFVLVTGAGVARRRAVLRLSSGVRFINDNRRPIRPGLKLIVQRVRQRHIAMERLLDK